MRCEEGVDRWVEEGGRGKRWEEGRWKVRGERREVRGGRKVREGER